MITIPNAADIVRWLRPFIDPGTVHELRILECVDFGTHKCVMFGYFDSEHLNELAEAALLWTDRASGCYVTMNPATPDLLARAANRVIKADRNTNATSNEEIVSRRRLVIDFDPVRVARVSATGAEKEMASQLAMMVEADLRALGWPEPMFADSGNGFHLNYLIDLPVDDGGVVQRFLASLSAKYSTKTVKVDTALFDPNRICKLYGTWSRKGDLIPTRPHRISRVVTATEILEIVDLALIESFIAANPPPEPEIKSKGAGRGTGSRSRAACAIASASSTKANPAPSTDIAVSGDIPVVLRPGDDYEARADWIRDIIGPKGWTIDKKLADGVLYVTRPGKNGGTSGTIGHNQGLHIFTSEGPPFEANGNYSKFGAFALLHHDGDHKAAAKDLAQQGYGTFIDDGGEVKQNPPSAENGRKPRYANFTARITREIVRHEAEITRQVEVQATHNDGTVVTVIIDAKDFDSMGWVSPKLGMKFAIKPGRSVKDLFQHSIKVTSYRKSVEVQEVFTALGWHVVGGKDVYLHADGAIAADGKADICVDIRQGLALYRLPAPDLSRLKEGTERVLAIIENLGPKAESVASIVMALPFRAILGPSRTVPHFAGTTGTLKTSTACLAARFYAPALEFSDSMPLSWTGTQAGMEELRYLAKDSLLVIDNLIADGEHANRDMAKADSVINSQGDLAGKARMKADGTSANRQDPRGCLISTGECEPRRKSSTGRSVIIEFKPGLIDLDGLKRCHNDARDGWFAAVIACYTQYLAAPGKLESQRSELRRLAQEYQDTAIVQHPGCHPRHAEAVGEWTAGFQLFLRFAEEKQAVTSQQAEIYQTRLRSRLFMTLAIQAAIQDEADPGDTFLEILLSLLNSKRAVLANMDGLAPDPEIAAACGWQRTDVYDRVTGNIVPSWDMAPNATRIGWIDENMVYLDPPVCHAAVERLARELGRTVGTQRQVCARLAETDRIKVEEQPDTERRRYTIRVRAEKTRHRVIGLPRAVLFRSAEESDDAKDSSDVR